MKVPYIWKGSLTIKIAIVGAKKGNIEGGRERILTYPRIKYKAVH